MGVSIYLFKHYLNISADTDFEIIYHLSDWLIAMLYHMQRWYSVCMDKFAYIQVVK
jgi:hypothetical protein